LSRAAGRPVSAATRHSLRVPRTWGLRPGDVI